jgi:CBS domain-containing protein
VSPTGSRDPRGAAEEPRRPEPADGARAMLTMHSPVSRVMRRDPFTVPLEATIRETLERMERTRTGVVVVLDPRRRIPLGVFTLEDVVRRVTLPGADLGAPIATVMTSGLVTVSPQASAHEAILTMARHGVQHLVVADAAGALAGLLSQDRLFGLQRIGVDEVGDEIQAAGDLDGLRAAALAIRRLTEALLAQAIHPETLTHFISTLNDLLTIRAVELTLDRFDLPPIPFCWIALGSEGRLEQTFSTDQDNGIILDADDADAERLREAFLPFARAVNETLAACGFPLCKGNVMASNPQWCLTLGEWQRAFSRWIDTPEPEAILNAEIFFDLRPVYGRAALAERLWEWLLPAARRGHLFVTLMAQNALGCRPPLGRIRDFVLDRSKEFPHTLDLKKHGSRIFVDAARVLALEHGIPRTSTAERLRAAADAGALDRERVAGVVDGFYFVHLLRLRNQFRRDASPEGANRLDPRRLTALDRIMLKEALREAKRLQDRLAVNHRLDALG